MESLITGASIYKRKDSGKWWMQYRSNGVRRRESLKTDKKGVATARMAARLSEIASETGSAKGRMSLDDFWSKFEKAYNSAKRPRTQKTNQYIWRRFSWWLGEEGVTALSQISVGKVEEYRSWLGEEAEELNGRGNWITRQALEETSINIIHRHLSSILGYAEKRGWIKENPWKKVEKYKVNDSRTVRLEAERLDAILEIAEKRSRNTHLLLALGIFAGFRRSEIVDSQWEWFDLKRRIILIQPHGGFVPKGHRSVPLPMNERLWKILEKYRQPSGYVLEASVWGGEEGNPIPDYWFYKEFYAVMEEAKIEVDGLTPHGLRHTFASCLADSGVSIFKVQKWLGHKSIETTMRYAHLQVHDDDINRI